MTSETCLVQLAILSKTLEPESIENTIGLKADRIWKLGEIRKPTILKEKENGWLLESSSESYFDLESHLDFLQKRLSGFEKKIKNLVNKGDYEIQVSCIFYCKEVPALNFENRQINWLNSLGASLDIDVIIIDG